VEIRRRRRVELGVDAVVARSEHAQHIAWAAREFVICGLPYRQPRSLTYVRRNGDSILRLIGSAEHGLPFGQDRLIPIWLASAFVAAGRPDDNVIRFRCASDILRAFGQNAEGGDHLARLRARLQRIFWCTFGITPMARNPQERATMREERHQLMRRLNVNILDPKRRASNQYSLWQDWIELDSSFAEELRGHGRVPVDIETVKALKECSPALDLYIWQAWRSFRLLRNRQAPTAIPLFGAGGLGQHLGSATSSPRKLRQLLRGWQAEVKKIWPDCPNYIDAGGEYFHLFPAETISSSGRVELPGVSNRPPMRQLGGLAGDDGATLSLFRDDDV
jgi:Plasmid encoded RepA protein